ncbi:hypothetical protein N8I77_001049 [Diaporthe amygdali]|uniref:Dol-P-Man:Man(5)GlcNAc(2)-PP-Dol alpha-1,3-mannosyltransferase n=1 Tax=Phomopsis amygdali TaxID=1214568 RepID=A0AAD9SQV6_PHOAM|nr:hypothetical protein N8I77_001049 [Diaporthe amygdali]
MASSYPVRSSPKVLSTESFLGGHILRCESWSDAECARDSVAGLKRERPILAPSGDHRLRFRMRGRGAGAFSGHPNDFAGYFHLCAEFLIKLLIYIQICLKLSWSGLTSALLLAKEKGNNVTVVAKHMPGDYDIQYTSPWAGANYLPMSTQENSRWERRTWPELKRLAAEVPEAGIHFQTALVMRNAKDLEPGNNAKNGLGDALFDENPWYTTFLDYRKMKPGDLPPGMAYGHEFGSVCINTAIYLPWLVGQCRKHGVDLKRASLNHISEASSLGHSGKADIIVNCTGLMASKLGGVMDSKVMPARGQIVVVRNVSPQMIATSSTEDSPDELIYAMTRAAGGGTILGGTYQKGNWDPNPDPNIAARIMQRAVDLYPDIAGGKGVKGLDIIRHGVGLRPYREGGVRLEKERIDGTWVVHNYGHAGWGYQGSYGTAERVVELVESCTMATNQDPLYLQVLRFAQDVATGRHWLSRLIPPTLLLLDAALCVLVIAKVAYTEIDWTAYMEQVQLFLDGERDYTKIEGGTGPLVYPAAHVYIYTGLYYLTNHGKDILLAQQLFAGLYLVNLAVAPPYVFPLLILSKRLHSIFMLRCFNDCFAVFFLWFSILLFQHRQWFAGGLVYSFGLGVKMTLLLVLPVVGILVFFAKGVIGTIALGGLMASLQVQLAAPFLRHPGAYFGRAFEFSRQFLFKWTVNWRFVGEEAFLSRAFSTSLLVLHISVLLTFIFTRWLPPTGKSLGDVLHATFSRDGHGRNWQALFQRFTPRYILTTVLTANIIGLLFARSLHYQFYSYLAWSTPYLLWRGGLHPVLQYVLWALQEWAWNVFPSTPASSAVVVSVMAITVAAVWFGTSDDATSSAAAKSSTDNAGAPTRSIRKP